MIIPSLYNIQLAVDWSELAVVESWMYVEHNSVVNKAGVGGVLSKATVVRPCRSD